MAIFSRLRITRPVDSRVPDGEKAIGAWLKQQGYPLLHMTRKIVNWLCDYVGYVGVDATDIPGALEDKLVDSSTVTWSKGGSDGNHTLSAAVAGVDDHLVKSSSTDATAVGGLVEKTDASGGTVLTEVTVGGVKKLRIYSPPAAVAISSVMPVHANDQARWLLDEAASYTFEPANTGHTAGDLGGGSGTAYQGVPGLRDANCVRMMTDARLVSPVNSFEYQTFSLHYWLRLNNVPNAGSGNICVGVCKLSNPGAYTTPWYSVALTASSVTISAAVLKTVSPREYVLLSLPFAPTIDRFPLNQWMHLGMTWDGEYLIMYVNGREYARSTAQTGITVQYDNHGEWCVGHPFTITSTSDCLIQDIRINDTALPESYFAELWHRGSTESSAILYPY